MRQHVIIADFTVSCFPRERERFALRAHSTLSDFSTPSNDQTSPSLLGRVRGRQPAAWQTLSELYGPIVYGWLRASGLGEHDAADATQEVFLSVHSSIDHFRKEKAGDRFRDWLWTITRRRAIDFFRKRTRQPAGAGGSAAHLMLHEVPDQLFVEFPSSVNVELQLVRGALELVRNEFEQRSWQACMWTVVEGRNAATVAAELGMSLGAVYIARSRILKRIRQELDGLMEWEKP